MRISIRAVTLIISLLSLGAAEPVCLNGFQTYHIHFDNETATLPTTLGLRYNNLQIYSRDEVCTLTNATLCTVSYPRSAPYFLRTFSYDEFNSASITNIPADYINDRGPYQPFNLKSFYFSCFTFNEHLNWVYAPCTLQTVEMPLKDSLHPGGGLTTSTHVFNTTVEDVPMQKVSLGSKFSNYVYFTLTSGSVYTFIALDNLVVRREC